MARKPNSALTMFSRSQCKIKPWEQLLDPDTEYTKIACEVVNIIGKYFRYKTINLHKVPKGKASLVVMNHGILPFHSYFIAASLFKEHGIHPRGLVARFLFSLPLFKDVLLKTGVHNANPKNAVALLKNQNTVIVTPGGIYEALVTKPGMKGLPWNANMGYVKVAIEANAPIVPTYCHGIDKTYFNNYFLLKERIKILELTKFSMPIFWGIGLLPFPVKLVHVVGDPIPTKAKKGESMPDRIKRIDLQVKEAMQKLASQKV